MIHRKWSLLTGPPAMLSSIVAVLVVANYVFGLNFAPDRINQGSDSFLKPDKKKEDVLASSK